MGSLPQSEKSSLAEKKRKGQIGQRQLVSQFLHKKFQFTSFYGCLNFSNQFLFLNITQSHILFKKKEVESSKLCSLFYLNIFVNFHGSKSYINCFFSSYVQT